jgi:membrane-associated phospholipid phosphatase
MNDSVTGRVEVSAPADNRSRWRLLGEFLTRPYPTSFSVVAPFALFCLLIPGYLVIGAYMKGRVLHMPALTLDRIWPMQPAWALVYGSLYFAGFLPMVVIRREGQLRRTIWAYVTMWLVAYVVFIFYPTVLPRPTRAEIGTGFFAWCLRIVYTWDAPYNCFPSLHVAQPYLAALTCYRVHRGIGRAAGVWATLVALSTLFTKQHYVADVVVGAGMAWIAYVIFLRRYPRAASPEIDDRVAPLIVWGFIGLHMLVIAGFWVAYLAGVVV